MINLNSQVTGQTSEQLLAQTNSTALNEGADQRGTGKTFFNLMTEFLGLNVDQGAKEKRETKLKSSVLDSFNELTAEKSGSEIQLDLINIEEGEKNSLPVSKAMLQTKDLPEEFLILISNISQMAGGQDPLIATEKNANADVAHITQEGDGQFKKPATIEGTLKVLNGLLDGFQIKRSGEKFVLTTPDSNTELTAEKKENIQNQLFKLVRQLSGHSEQNSVKHPVSGITAKPDVEIPFSTDSKKAAKTIKEASSSALHFSNNRLGFMRIDDVDQGKIRKAATNTNQKTETQQTQKLSLKDVIRLFSQEVEVKTEKSTQPQTVPKQISSESKESAPFPNLKEKSGLSTKLSTKQMTSQSDRKLQTNVDLSKSLQDEISKQEGELTSRKLDAQNSKNSSLSKLADKSQTKPLQISSISEVKKDEIVFKPLVKIEAQNGNVDLEFQSQADTDSGDSEEGKSFLKLNNTSFTQLTKSSGRREFSTQMIKQLQKQADQSGLGTAKNWSQHRFLLESGESVNLAVRQSEGVMQLQLGAGNSELNKILIQHINEIRQHLQDQMNIDIDLQLQQFGDQQADFADNGQNSGNGKQESNNGTGILRQHAETEIGDSKTRTRYLGFNQNEWTA